MCERKRELLVRGCAVAAIVALLMSGLAQAEQWSGQWMAVTAKCSNGAKVSVMEEAGSLKVKNEAVSRDIPPSERVIPVGADGSGKLMYSHAALGSLEMRVVAGKGRRQVLLTQQRGDLCQWEVK